MKLSMQTMTTMGGDDLSRPHQRNGCEFATPMIFSPKKMSPISDDDNRDDYHDNDDKESEKTLILGAD